MSDTDSNSDSDTGTDTLKVTHSNPDTHVLHTCASRPFRNPEKGDERARAPASCQKNKTTCTLSRVPYHAPPTTQHSPLSPKTRLPPPEHGVPHQCSDYLRRFQSHRVRREFPFARRFAPEQTPGGFVAKATAGGIQTRLLRVDGHDARGFVPSAPLRFGVGHDCFSFS